MIITVINHDYLICIPLFTVKLTCSRDDRLQLNNNVPNGGGNLSSEDNRDKDLRRETSGK